MSRDHEPPVEELTPVTAPEADPGMRDRIAGLAGELIARLLNTGDEGWHKVPIRVPQEIVSYSKEQVAALRAELIQVMRKEVANYFSSLNLSSELLKLLTYLTFEVKMQIRLVPTDRGSVELQTKTEVNPVAPESPKKS
jgi:hypothetical protein